MVSAIENRYVPDYVSPPGETLLDTIEALGMSQAELAERTGRPPKTISEIIKGKSAITSETALQLEKVLGAPASFWTSRERHYRESLARQKDQSRLQEQIDWLKNLPVKAMCAERWIRRFDDKVQQLREVLRFFGVASPAAWHEVWRGPQVAFRQSKAFESDPGAVAAWLRKGEIKAQSIQCNPYDPVSFRKVLNRARGLTVEPPEVFQPQLVQMCADVGVAVVFVPELPKTRLFGATRWLSPNKALIQLSLRYKTNDHLWFTFFHEAGHILLHGKRDVFIESESDKGAKESKADRFSEDCLIPRAEYHAFVRSRARSKIKVRSFADEIGIAPGIVVGRLQHDGKLLQSHLNSLKRHYHWVRNAEAA
ncbi:MAG: HigA family addiction module antitoxin [Armatimonadota bacterium]|nr:HigA family addiction module antitoxin [Armatimonadota bacterium]